MLLSLVSFDQNDPSINHAVSNPAIVKNYAGLFGAYLSGLLVDIFGFAALVWPLVFLAWGAGCVSTWFTMPWWRWFGFTLLAACLISLGAAWNLGIGDVRGGGMLGMSLYTKFTTLFSPVGSSLIWLFLLFISLEMAFGIAWIALIRKGWALLREQLSGTPFSLDDLPERLSKVSMPKVALPKIGLPHKDKKAEGETAADVIALFDIHDEEERPAPKREEPLSMDPPFSLTPEETPAAPKKDAGDPLKLWEPPSEHDTFDFQPEEPRAGTGTFAPQVNIHLASPTDAAAKAVNLPKDKIDAAIRKGTGEDAGGDLTETFYEGYGPGGIAVMVEVATDNKNRTVAEVRHLFTKHGGSMGENGSVGWMFDRKGVISVDKAAYPEDKIMEAALEAGADDVIDDEDVWTLHTAMADFGAVRDALEAAGIAMQSAELAMVPQNLVAVDADMGQKVLRFMDALDDNDDVQNVYANVDFPDDMPTD